MKSPAGRKSLFFCLQKSLSAPVRTGLPAIFRLKISASFPVLLPRRALPLKKKLYSKTACGYFRGMNEITALIEAAALPVIFTGGIGFCVWLVKGFLTNIEKIFEQKLGHTEKVLGEKIGHIDKQLNNHITETNDKIKELQADVKGLKSGQAALEVKIEKGQAALEVKNAERHAELAEGQAKLEVKIADGQAELYKLLSSKSPDKKQ